MPNKTVARTFVALAFSAFLCFPALAEKPADAELFMKGRLAADEERLEEALEIFDQLVARQEDDPVLHFERAKVLGSLRRYEQSENALRKVIELDPSFYDARKTLGRLLLDRSAGARSRVEEALEHLEIAYQLQPNDLATGLTISQVLLGLGKTEEAKKVVEGLLERMPDHRSVNYQYAQILLREGDREGAAKFLENVVIQEPYYRPALSQLLEIYEEQGRFPEAVDLIEVLAVQEPENLEVRRRQAYLLLRAQRFEESRGILEAILQAEPGDMASIFMFAEVLSELGRYEEAEEHYRKVLLTEPDDPEVLISFGLNQIAMDDLETASKQFQRLLEIEGLPPRIRAVAVTQLAAIDHRSENYDAALARARGVLRTDGVVNLQAVNITLDVLKRKQSHGEALELLDELTANLADAPLLDARKIEFLILSDREEEAKTLALTLAKKSFENGLTAARMYAQMDRYDDVVLVLEAMDEQWKGEIEYLFQLGAAYERTDQFESSQKAFQSILEEDPKHAATLNYLGYMWADLGIRLEEAERLISEAVRQYPENGAYVDSLGWVYYKLGKYDLAEKHLLDAARLIPDDPTIQEHLGDLFIRLGDLERAMTRYEQALKLSPEDEIALRKKVSELEQKLAARIEK